MRRLDVIAVLLLLPSAASAQTTVFEVKSGEPDDFFAGRIANVGDMDGDGFADLGVGASGSDVAGVDAGALYVYSGRTGSVLHVFRGVGGDQLGGSVSGAGDVDEDGTADILVGARQRSSKLWVSQPGFARVYSGRTGEEIRSYIGIKSGDGLGTAVANVGDVDADGADDHAASATGPTFDYVRVYSGHTGELIRTHSTGNITFLGLDLLGVGDFDGDGHGDYAIGEPTDTSVDFTDRNSWVRVYSGKTSGELFNVGGSDLMSGLGGALASPGDLDGDGKADLWVGAYVSGYAGLFAGPTGTSIVQEHHGRGFFGGAVACADVDGDGRRDLLVGSPRRDSTELSEVGAVEVFSSTNGALLLEFEGSAASERMGTSLAHLGDLNGDGFEEFAVGARSGYARVLSPIDLPLSSSQPHPLVSTTSGSAVIFELDAGPGFAFLFHLLLGSASGQFPAVPLAPGVDLPLVPDWYTQTILHSLGSPPFQGFLGSLDANGAGRAHLDLASGVDPALIGITLYHAFVVFDPSGSAAFASNALSSKLLPDPAEFPVCDFPIPPLAHPGTELVFDGSDAFDPNGSSLLHTWDFGDGSTATGSVVTHAFASAGAYQVTLRVADDEGNVSACTRVVPVDLPNARAACAFEITQSFTGWIFDANGSVDGDGSIDLYTWDFGDGTSIQTDVPDVFHEYSAAGAFTITLTVTDDDGATSTCSRMLVVYPNGPLTCAFEIQPFLATWLFDASASVDGDGSIELYDWDFGDGTSMQTDSSVAFHHYSGAGTYTVTLTIIDDSGATSTCIQVIVVP